MESEKLTVESCTNLLCLDNNLSLLYSLLKKADLTKEEAKYLSKLTLNLDSGIRKSVALKRSSLFHKRHERTAGTKSISSEKATTNKTHGVEIMKVHLTKTAADLPEPAGAILKERKKTEKKK